MLGFLLWCILFILCWPLALGGPVPLSHRLAASASLPHRRHRRGRSAGAGLVHHHSSRPRDSHEWPKLSRARQSRNRHKSASPARECRTARCRRWSPPRARSAARRSRRRLRSRAASPRRLAASGGQCVMSIVVRSIDTAPMMGAQWPFAITRPLFDSRCGMPSA